MTWCCCITNDANSQAFLPASERGICTWYSSSHLMMAYQLEMSVCLSFSRPRAVSSHDNHIKIHKPSLSPVLSLSLTDWLSLVSSFHLLDKNGLEPKKLLFCRAEMITVVASRVVNKKSSSCFRKLVFSFTICCFYKNELDSIKMQHATYLNVDSNIHNNYLWGISSF